MVKYYKTTDKKELQYKEAWFDEQKHVIVVHFGKVGFIGKCEEISIKDSEAVDVFFEKFAVECLQDGFKEMNEENFSWIVVQYSLKSELGNKRDLWLKDKVQEYLKNHLGWHGLGDVDGFDIGNKKLNIFCFVVDEDRAVSSIKTCLKESRLDLTHARIAAKKFNEEEYRLKFSHKKIDKFELI